VKILPVKFLLLISSLALVAAETKFILPPESTNLKPGRGVELVTSQCLICHSADYISTQPRLTDAQWTVIVSKMQQKYGAPLTTNSVPLLAAYLTKSYGTNAAQSPAR
jgi:hypothetical protein